LHPPVPVTPAVAPGTTALRSPPGFEESYEALRSLRVSSSRPLVHLAQLAAAEPLAAARLSERVDFDVPRTVPSAFRKFFSHPTAKFIATAFGLTALGRASLGNLRTADAVVAFATAVAWCLQEWVIHDKLLHSEREWFAKDIHRWHHELPYFHVSLDGIGLAAVWFSVVGACALAAGAVFRAIPASLTGLTVYTLFGGLYEASHFLAHTRVPLPKPLQNIRNHHMRHHVVNDEYWLAFTIPAIDNVFGTNPRPSDVGRWDAGGRRGAARRRSRAV